MNNQNTLSDKKLIQYYLNGDPNAFTTLVELYKDKIYRSVYSIVQDKHAAEEIFNQTFIRIINNLVTGNNPGKGNFLKWAIKIANDLCLEHAAKAYSIVALEGSFHESHRKTKSMITAFRFANQQN